MNDCIFKDCNLTSNDNTSDLIHEDLQKQMETLLNTTTAKMLMFEGKLSDLCKYIKDNLSNTLRELILDMEYSGELTKLISKAVFDGYALVQQRVQHYITPQMYGAMGNGITDDTEGIQKAIDSLDENVRILHFPSGTYLVSEDIILKSGIVLRGDGVDSVIQRTGTDADRYNVLKLENGGRVTIENLFIKGDRSYGHEGTSGEWGMCIGLYGCSDVRINNCTLTEGWGDGVYVGASEDGGCYNISIDGCVIDSNRRNGVSVIECDGFRMVHSKLLNSDGTAPKAGIDFEPNSADQMVKNCLVADCYFSGNLIDVCVYDRNAADVTVQNCKFNSRYGVQYDSVILGSPAVGAVNFCNCVFNNSQNCYLSNRKHINSVPVNLVDCVLSSDAVAVQVGGVSLSYNENMGNLHLVNCYIAKSPNTSGWFRFQNTVTTATIVNVTLDVRLADGVCKRLYFTNSYCDIDADIKCGKPNNTITANLEINKNTIEPLYLVDTHNGNVEISLSHTIPFGVPFTIRKLFEQNTITVVNMAESFGQYDYATAFSFGSRFDEVTLIHESGGVWRVVDHTVHGVDYVEE